MNEMNLILQRTDGGLAIFIHYLGEKCLSKVFSNPYREDARPSCRLYRNQTSSGEIQYYLQDFGDSSYCGNCFTFVSKIAHININTDFLQILKVIDRDLNLGVFRDTWNDIQVQAKCKKALKIQESSPIIDFQYTVHQPKQWEIDYWKKYGISLDTLKKYNVYFLDDIVFKRKDKKDFSLFASKAIPMYGYLFSDDKGIKIYRPTAKTRFMYAGQLPKPYIFGYDQLPDKGEYIIITGGEKDVLALAAHGFNAISFNSETASISEDFMKTLAHRFNKIIFLYDMDSTGKKESEMRVKEFKEKFNVYKVELPLSGNKKEKDISDYFALGKTDKDLKLLIKN